MTPKTPSKPKGGKHAAASPRKSRAGATEGISRKALEPEVLPKLPEPGEESDEESAQPESEENFDDALERDSDDASTLPAVSERDIVTVDSDDDDLGEGTRAVSASDPLRRYLEEVRRYPLLPPEEEFRLVTRLREQGDMMAAKALVSANLRLVVKIAMEYRSMYSNVMDLIQEGNVGLMKAVSKYDPTKGARLGYYASWWIRSYILKYLLDNFRLVRIGTTQAQKKLFYHLMREKERLEAQGVLAGPKLLAEKLNVREKDVVEMETRLSGRGSEMSLDAPIETDSGRTTHLDLMVDDQESADEALARDELLKMLKARLPEFQQLLNEKERQILKERLLAEEPKTLQEVADVYGLTRERARQIEAKVIAKLREFLVL